jgi:hypothetical protein
MDCGHRYEALFLKDSDLDDERCPNCQSSQLQVCLSAHGGYSIKGNNGASQRPRQAGSFRGKK